MSAEPGEQLRPPSHRTRNVLLLLGGGFAAAFALIAVFTSKATSVLLFGLAAFVLLLSFAIWVAGTDMTAPESWTPGTRRARLAVLVLVALTYAACCWNGFSERSGMRLRAVELQPLFWALFLMLPKPANRKSRTPESVPKGA